jgi:hypothetical protein
MRAEYFIEEANNVWFAKEQNNADESHHKNLHVWFGDVMSIQTADDDIGE